MEVGCAAIEAFHRGAFSRKLLNPRNLRRFSFNLYIPFSLDPRFTEPQERVLRDIWIFYVTPFFAGVERKRNVARIEEFLCDISVRLLNTLSDFFSIYNNK